MSRGFVKEGDQEEVPIVPPRAHLPVGVTNYVTQQGYDDLLKEQEELIAERTKIQHSDAEDKHIGVNFITAKLKLLEDRIRSATVVDTSATPKDKVYFGATVTLFKGTEVKIYTIVGVDEADISKNKISFLSPIAKSMINKKIGDEIILKSPKGPVNMLIKDIKY